MSDYPEEVTILDSFEDSSSDDLLDFCEPLQDGFIDECPECGAIVVDGEVSTCLGSSNDCSNMSNDDFALPPGHPLKFE